MGCIEEDIIDENSHISDIYLSKSQKENIEKKRNAKLKKKE